MARKILVFLFAWSSWLVFAHEIIDPKNNRLKNLIYFKPEIFKENGLGVTVAIVDTGVSETLSAIKENLLLGKNFVDASDEGRDYDGHGSAIAGILLQIAPKISILPIAVAKNGVATNENVFKGLLYAFTHGAQIINLSITVDDTLLKKTRDVVGEERFYQSLLVIAAGNERNYFPKTAKEWPNVLFVGAATLEVPISLTDYSAYGDGVDIAAPAGESEDGITTCDAFSKHLRLFNGTSAAVPVVAGFAALIKQKYTLATGTLLKNIIIQYSLPTHGIKVNQGRLLSFKRWT